VRVLLHIPVAVAVLLTVQPVSPQAPNPGPEEIPQLTLWRNVKHSLEGADGARFFEENLKGALLPGGANGVQFLVGKILSSQPENSPGAVVLAMSDTHTPEVTLRLVDKYGNAAYLKMPVSTGTNVAFQGVAKSFSPEPFLLTFEVELGDFLILDKTSKSKSKA
jgi:hypothetical protein